MIIPQQFYTLQSFFYAYETEKSLSGTELENFSD